MSDGFVPLCALLVPFLAGEKELAPPGENGNRPPGAQAGTEKNHPAGGPRRAGWKNQSLGGTKGWQPHSSGKYTWYQMRKDSTVYSLRWVRAFPV